MGTTHFSGLNVKHFKTYAAGAPTSLGTVTVTGIATDDVILDLNVQKAATAYTTARLTTTAYTISAANTVKMKGTTSYSGYVIDVLWLDMDKA
jgi:hypothetical protein